MELHQVLPVHTAHLQRIRLTEVVLREKRQLRQVIKALDVFGRTDSAALEPRTVEVVRPHAAEGLLQPLQLDFRILVP